MDRAAPRDEARRCWIPATRQEAAGSRNRAAPYTLVRDERGSSRTNTHGYLLQFIAASRMRPSRIHHGRRRSTREPPTLVEEAPTPVAVYFVFVAAVVDEGVEEQPREARSTRTTDAAATTGRGGLHDKWCSRCIHTTVSACCRHRPSANLATYVGARDSCSAVMWLPDTRCSGRGAWS